MKSFLDFINRAKATHGDKFDPSELAYDFIHHYQNGSRIEVQMSYGEKLRGRVGITTGWKPVFILLPRINSRGSSVVLSAKDRVTQVISYS